jgi:hypothetical protein
VMKETPCDEGTPRDEETPCDERNSTWWKKVHVMKEAPRDERNP